MRLQFVRVAGLITGALGAGGGLWAMVGAGEALPPLEFVLVAVMGLSAVMVGVAGVQLLRGRARAYRRLEIAAWGLAVMTVLTMGGAGFYFAPAALAAIVTLGLAVVARRGESRSASDGKSREG